MKPEIVLVGPIYAATMRQLESAYTVHRLWQASDPKALLSTLADRVDGSVAFPVTEGNVTAGNATPTPVTLPPVAVAVTSGGRGMRSDEMQALPGLKLITCFGVGVDSIDLAVAQKRGIAVTNTPDVLTECVADTTWMLILATIRKAVFNDAFVRSGKWLQGSAPLTDKVWGENMGIIGFGRIGKAIARRAEGFGMRIAYHGRAQQKDVAYPYYADVAALADWAKILVVACPGGKQTENIVDARVLEALGKEGYVFNISRGSTIDEQALVKALESGSIAGAGLDVFADEPRVPETLFRLDNVVLQLHVGSGTHHTRNAMGQLVLDNLAAWFAGKPLVTPVI